MVERFYWCEPMGGIELEAWYFLHLPFPHTLKKWIAGGKKDFVACCP
ncbi:hypothetical protein J0Q64_004751 [Salmonella enterica subsp. enterica serovar Newport]|nr:hypothetical protein [Salmonella enterica subsp. enterica serovar Newport]EHR2383257.1 hypothetical protein [Salmonella enterica subsp. enterica serovar Newport]HBM0103137.1 hypothetical protein [Salmonella enterica subsp. enterica serovar Wedding]